MLDASRRRDAGLECLRVVTGSRERLALLPCRERRSSLVWVTSQGLKTRILSSLFSSQLIGDNGVETQACFNMSFAGGSADVNQC